MNTPDTAPKDGKPFLANVGHPWLLMCCWNPVTESWCCAMPQTDLYEGKFQDTYFENHYFDDHELIGWLPVPEIEQPSRALPRNGQGA
ncbi:MAG: hypothetical protein M0O99_02270 [Desulfuromonas thiophila]|nr:hypothetical protein [Desulfuromonas thiophila]